MAYKHTTHYQKIGNIWVTNDRDHKVDIFLNAFEILRNMMECCDMFRLSICEYTLIWYRNGFKARLTICENLTK